MAYATSLLLKFDGNITDSSPNNVALTNSGVTISTAQSKFGGSSAYFDGNSHLKTTPSSGSMIPSTGNWTVDWWEYPTSQVKNSAIFEQVGAFASSGAPYGLIIGYLYDGEYRIYLSTNGTSWNALNGVRMGEIKLNEWTHRAVVRSGNTIHAFENGTLINSFSFLGSIMPEITDGSFIGLYPYTGSYSLYNGYIDNFRVSNMALWMTNFTPPTEHGYNPYTPVPTYVWDVYNVKTSGYSQTYTTGKQVYAPRDNSARVQVAIQYTFNASNGQYGRVPNENDVYTRVDSIDHGHQYMFPGYPPTSTMYESAGGWVSMINGSYYEVHGRSSTGRKYTAILNTSKGTINSFTTSTNASAYPQDAVSGSYWYTFRGAPSNISYPTSIEAGQAVQITWEAGTNPLYYRVERSTDGGASWLVLSATVTGTSFTDTSIAGDTSSPSVMYRVCTLGEMAVSDYSTGSEVNIPRCSVRIKINGAWVKGKATYRKENGAWVIIPMADEAAIFGADTHRKVILLTS